jgi:hypothetical protein
MQGVQSPNLKLHLVRSLNVLAQSLAILRQLTEPGRNFAGLNRQLRHPRAFDQPSPRSRSREVFFEYFTKAKYALALTICPSTGDGVYVS